MTPQPKPESNEPDGPAIETELHRWSRPATDDNGKAVIGKVGCVKWTPLFAAFESGKLEGGKYSAVARLIAGQDYEKLYDNAQPTGKDSTQALNGSRSTGSGLPLGTEQRIAAAALARVDKHIPPRDLILLQRFIGDRWMPARAVRQAMDGEHKDTASGAVRLALNSLIEAQHKAREGVRARARKVGGGVV